MNRKYYPVVFYLVLFITALNVQGATVTGSVVSAAEGSPLPGMTVAAYSTDGTRLITSATTGTSGIYTMPIGAGSYRILAFDPEGQFATSFYDDAPVFEISQIVTLDDTTTVSVDFRLQRNGWITGTVTAAEDDRALGGMVIAAYDSKGFRRGTVRSDSNGGYKLALPPERYRIAAWDDSLEHAVQFYPAEPTYDTATVVNVESRSTVEGIDFELLKSAVITGVVTDRQTGAPLPNMTIEAWTGSHRAQRTTTGELGRYVLHVPPTSLRLLSWDAEGIYATAFEGNATSFEATPVRSPSPGESISNADFILIRGGRVNGVVRSASSGFPLEGVIVAGFNPDGTVRTSTPTDSAGRYSLLLPPGTYVIGTWDQNFDWLTQFHPLQRTFEDATRISVDSGIVIEGLDFLLVEAGQVKGIVRSSSDSTPLEGIQLSLYSASGAEVATTWTTRDGRFVLAAEPGTYRLLAADSDRVFATWYYDGARNFEASSTLSVVAGDEVAVAIVLVVAGRVEGTVRDLATNEPIKGIDVSAYDLGGDRIGRVRTDDSGQFSLLVPPCSCRIVATDPSRRYATSWYENAVSFSDAKTILLGSGIVRPMDFGLELGDFSRRRSVRGR